MHQLCRIDIKKGDATYREIGAGLKQFCKKLRKKYRIRKIIAFGSYVRRDLNEGSDIDLIIVGNFNEKFHKRTANVLALTELPVEPLCYTEEEFEKMVKENNSFLKKALNEGMVLF
jgi:hypothetical protein